MTTPNEIWIIRHPGTLEYLIVSSFSEAMSKWFEGFNPPIKVTAELPEESTQRVRDYYAITKL